MRPSTDPLLAALRCLGRFHGVPVHPDGAIHGLPLANGKLTPTLFARAAKRCGFRTRLVQRPLNRIHEATFPVILLLKDNQAAVLLERREGGLLELATFPGEEQRQSIPATEFESQYTGYAILLKPVRNFEDRSDFAAGDASEERAGHWFWGTLWRFRSFYARVALATVFINLLALSSTLFIKNIYDRVVPNQATGTLWVLTGGVLFAYLFEFILKTLRTFFVDRAGHRIDLILGAELFARVLGMRFENRPASAGALASQARAYEALREFFASATIAALADLPFVFVFAGIVWLLGGVTAVPLLAGAVIALATGIAMQWPIAGAVSHSYRAANQRQALFVEGVHSLEWIKATRSESQLQSRYEETIHVSASAEGNSRAYSQLAINLTGLIQQALSAAIVVVAYFQVLEEKMTMGAMIACVILAGRAMAPLGLVASLLTRLQQSRRSLQGLDGIMRTPPERDERGDRYVGLDHFEANLAAHHVLFSHDPKGEPVLKDVTFAIQPGERVALLGRTGSGKSTVLRLLTGLYSCTGGTLTAGGIDVRQFDPAEWRRRVGYVPQETCLLYGTLRSCLTAGCRDVSDEAIWKAVQRTGLTGFVRSLPRGLDHPVAEGGRNLSGGQRQAISLARALIEAPPILILDEPTSAMDQNTEQHVLRELAAYLAEDPRRTLIVATHRRSVLQLINRILVLDGGKIIADGPRDSVLKVQNSSPAPRATRPAKPDSDHEPDLALAPSHCLEMPSSPATR